MTLRDPHGADADAPPWRILSSGRCYAYVLPCREMDCLKVGFTRDPLARLRTLHPRHFEVFDLDRAALVEVEHVRDARAIESALKRSLAEYRSTEPLVIRSRAGGKHEWYRGACPQALDLIERRAEDDGFRLHRPLSSWLRESLLARRDVLYSGSQQLLDALQFAREQGVEADARGARVLVDVLDTCVAVGIDPRSIVPEAVAAWHARGGSA